MRYFSTIAQPYFKQIYEAVIKIFRGVVNDLHFVLYPGGIARDYCRNAIRFFKKRSIHDPTAIS